MTAKEFGKIVNLVRNAYNDKEFLAKSDSMKVWFEFFAPMDYRTVAEAVKRHIKVSRNLPAVSDIMNLCKEVENERKLVLKTLKEYYENARSYMPRDMLKPTDQDVFFSLVKSRSYEECLRKGKYIGFETKGFLERNYRREGLTFEICMREVMKRYDAGGI